MKKRYCSFILSVLVLFCSLFSINFYAYASDYTYSIISDTEVCITKYSGTDTDVSVPSEIDGYTVTKIGEKAFFRSTTVQNVVIPEGVTEIGEQCFSNFGLQSIVLPNSLEIIGDSAFQSTSLKSIQLPENLKSIGDQAFRNSQIENLFIPKGVSHIGENVFINNSHICSVTVDESNQYFCSENNALYDKGKTELIIFASASEQTEITVPDTVKKISKNAFEYSNIQSIVLPEGLKVIEEYAFSRTKIAVINIPDSVVSIGSYCFDVCSQLTSINIGKGLETVGTAIFNQCTKLKNISVSADNEYFSAPDDVLLGNKSTELICYPSRKPETEYKVPDSVTTIKEQAFGFCLVNNIDLNNVEVCENYAFYNTSLKYIIIPENLQRIDNISIATDCSVKVLNPDCIFSFSANSFLNYDITIYGYENSTAQQFAENNTKSNLNITFIPLTEYEEKHNYIGVTVEPTCTEKGYTVFTCSKCGDSYTDDYTDALGHNIVIDKAVSETCTENGLTEGTHCSRCSEIIKAQETVKATGHTFIQTVVEPTCTNQGCKTFVCSKCGYSYSEAIAKSDHNYVTKIINADFEKAGSQITYCSVCNNIEAETSIAKIKSVTLSKMSYTYTGRELKKPTVTVKDANGNTISRSNYTVTYISRSTGKSISNLKAIGQYKVRIEFKGCYSGTKDLYFFVKPKRITKNTLSSSKKAVTAKWAKDSSATGYQIVIATNSSFTKNKKTVTLGKNSITSYKFKNLKKGVKYYVKVRSYKTVKVDGKKAKMYSDYSSVKSIKCK